MKNKVSFVDLLETKVKDPNIQNIQKIFGVNWKWYVNNIGGQVGRIWIGWQPAELTVQVVDVDVQTVLCEVTPHHQPTVFILVVYGKNDAKDRKELWNRLLSQKRSVPWLISGDFNAILKLEDRLHGGTLTEI